MDKLPDDQDKIMSFFTKKDHVRFDTLIDEPDYGDGVAVQLLVDAGYVGYKDEINNPRFIATTGKGQEYRRHWHPCFTERIFDLTMENRKLKAQVARAGVEENTRLRKHLTNVKNWAYLYSLGDYTADDVIEMIEGIELEPAQGG